MSGTSQLRHESKKFPGQNYTDGKVYKKQTRANEFDMKTPVTFFCKILLQFLPMLNSDGWKLLVNGVKPYIRNEKFSQSTTQF